MDGILAMAKMVSNNIIKEGIIGLIIINFKLK